VAQLAANAATVLYSSTNQLQLLEIIDYLFGFKNATTAAKNISYSSFTFSSIFQLWGAYARVNRAGIVNQTHNWR